MSDVSPADDETDAERINRNWIELLQELRVTQTGVQILTAFLLILPFQRRFPTLSNGQQWLYVCVLVGSVISTALITAPVCFHRLMFRKRLRVWLVDAGDRAARAGLLFLALTMIGAVALVVDVAVGRVAASILTVAVALLFGTLWWLLPVTVLRRSR
ncbi:MAG TPA: DUF6328 family protein [Nocardioidaceae bacterium]|nr:DUF6328 family protein [Nocardioidaceae bacterium]